MNVRRKFIVFSTLWGIVPVIVLTSIYIANFKTKGMELIKQNIVTFSNDQAVSIEAFFQRNINNNNVISDSLVVRELLENSNNVMSDENIKKFNDAVNKDSFSIRQMLFNKQGKIIAATDNIYKNFTLSEEEMKRLENNELVITDIVEGNDFNNYMKSAIIASPIFFDGQYKGFIVNVINMNYFDNLVRRAHLFKSGEITIVDKNGITAASNSNEFKESISSRINSSNLQMEWNKIEFNNKPQGTIEFTINGIEKIGYYKKINNSGWIVLSDVDLAEFKEPINKSLEEVSIFSILIFLLVISANAFTINEFSKPINSLLKAIGEIKNGNYEDRFIYDKKDEFGEIATAFNELIDEVQNNRKYIEDKNRQLKSLTSNIPGGVHRHILISGKYYMDFLSSGYLKIIGYKRSELNKLLGKNILDIIYEADHERVKRGIDEQISKDDKFTVEYRIKRKDGSVIWVLDKGRIIKDNDGKIFSYNVAMDINDSKIALEKLKLSEERYRIITSQTDNIIFEWNVKEDTVHYYGNLKNRSDLKQIFENVTKKLYKTDYIHIDDKKVFGKMLNEIVIGEPYKETEIRMKTDDEYIWNKIRISAMFDENGDISRAIGIIIDIDKERKETEELVFKAERDSLTGLYNKGTTERLIEEYINNNKGGMGALFQIDLDNFKKINDNLGHLAGDFVLTNMSSMLIEIFSENSIVGRIGGDEFIVFLKEVESEELIYRKAEQLVLGFRTNFTKEFLNYKLSGSIGIAKYPEHGENFQDLYIKADKATYLAKNKGKDNYCIFEEN
ncbi:diguanylate cyclase domain-containing protein [Clostridium saccharoperbutylacetonicum]|uniref:sensor domain-containing diguanylate cyclase n=1 Tax=Clostridium saccharoperbutylacetonicum TaxID=36745 RepID=UPI0039EC47EC